MATAQDKKVIKLPFYARAALIVTGLFFFLSMMALGKSIIVPLLFSAIISILLSTIVDYLVKRKVDRVLSIILTMLLAAGITVLLAMFMISQFNMFIEALPELNEKFTTLQHELATWLSESFGINPKATNEWMNTARADLTTMSSKRVGDTINLLGNAIIIMILIPVYIFLMLFYQPLIVDFIHKFVGDGHKEDVGIVLDQTKTLLKAYFTGLMIELIVVSVLNAIGLLALDIEYAILLGILGGFLNMIPYIGGMMMLGLSMLMAMLSHTEPVYAVYAAIVFFVIQIIDNYFLIPKIVGSKVKINALVSIVAVIAGGAIWGIVGMFIAIPLTAILKVIFDRIEPLKPWGYIMGDTMPPLVRLKLPVKRRKPARES
jgi:predicted PurR-regulated permease PerM